MKIDNVLVVCVGNICRSPMAAAVLQNALRGHCGVNVSSAGLSAMVGAPASGYAIDLMKDRGMDISAHRARQLTPQLIRENDLILVLESDHKRVIHAKEPTSRGKVHRLGKWEDANIPDPYGMPKSAFEDALEMIDRGCKSWAKKIKMKSASEEAE